MIYLALIDVSFVISLLLFLVPCIFSFPPYRNKRTHVRCNARTLNRPLAHRVYNHDAWSTKRVYQTHGSLQTYIRIATYVFLIRQNTTQLCLKTFARKIEATLGAVNSIISQNKRK